MSNATPMQRAAPTVPRTPINNRVEVRLQAVRPRGSTGGVEDGKGGGTNGGSGSFMFAQSNVPESVLDVNWSR